MSPAPPTQTSPALPAYEASQEPGRDPRGYIRNRGEL